VPFPSRRFSFFVTPEAKWDLEVWRRRRRRREEEEERV